MSTEKQREARLFGGLRPVSPRERLTKRPFPAPSWEEESMTTCTARRGRALGFLAVAILAASCKSKQQPPAQAPSEPPSAAPTTTLPPPPTTVPTPPPVWRTSHWGMTPQEVLAAFPDEAQQLTARASFAQPQPGSSLVAGSSDITIPAFELEGTKFRVLFGFEADALNRVHLSALKAGPATCDDLQKSLTAKHSSPAERGSTGGSLRGQEITWKLPDQTIVLSCAGVASLGFQTVSLDYLAPSRDAAKD
jgi:hypothetical protein